MKRVQPRLNRIELAWAAGFFDGEGCVSRKKNQSNGRRAPFLQVSQTNRVVLDRFQAAVGGLGVIYGPYRQKKRTHSPYWLYSTSNFEATQAVGTMLWSFLSPVKKEAYAREISSYLSTPCRKGGPK